GDRRPTLPRPADVPERPGRRHGPALPRPPHARTPQGRYGGPPREGGASPGEGREGPRVLPVSRHRRPPGRGAREAIGPERPPRALRRPGDPWNGHRPFAEGAGRSARPVPEREHQLPDRDLRRGGGA